MSQALIGCTGFVGGNLLRQARFDAAFHSKNIQAIRGRSFDLVVCAAAPGQKWKANLDPAADRAAVERLMDGLEAVRAAFFVLISTIDVYAEPWDVDEDSGAGGEKATPYGRHRRELERFVAGRFDHLIVRLPGLFGPGLKKNAVYDLLHDNQLHKIHADSRFQFYSLAHLWDDLQKIRPYKIPLLNIAAEPVAMAEVAQAAFGKTFDNRPAIAPARYDMRSKYAGIWGGSGGYQYSKASVLEELKAFVASEREGLP